jgi:hypothetical protein
LCKPNRELYRIRCFLGDNSLESERDSGRKRSSIDEIAISCGPTGCSYGISIGCYDKTSIW